MCKWGTEVRLRVPIPPDCSHTGQFRWDTKPVDACLAPLVQALNDAGLYTGGCCCGHGKGPTSISLHDGHVLHIHHTRPDKMACGQEHAPELPGMSPTGLVVGPIRNAETLRLCRNKLISAQTMNADVMCVIDELWNLTHPADQKPLRGIGDADED